MNANELRKIALEYQELEYLKNYNNTLYRLDKIIEERAKNGWTFLFLKKRKNSCEYITDGYVFWYLDEMLKDLKKYYEEKGFEFSKSFFRKEIYIAW